MTTSISEKCDTLLNKLEEKFKKEGIKVEPKEGPIPIRWLAK
ncbi:hypothetical protein ES703_68023 [subsurface metagenome]